MPGTQGDERGADVLAMGEGRETLDVNSEQARERVGLGVTELWELGRHMLNRAMSLAQLHSGQWRALSHRSGRRREPVGGQCCCQRFCTCGDVLARVGELDGIPLFELGAAFAGELAHGILASMLRKKAQRRGGHVVAVASHAIMAGLGQDVGAGRTTTTAAERASGGWLVLLDGTLFKELVKVPSDGRWRQPQTRGKSGCGERAELGDRLSDPVAGAGLEDVLAGVGPVSRGRDAVGSDKHNTSVT